MKPAPAPTVEGILAEVDAAAAAELASDRAYELGGTRRPFAPLLREARIRKEAAESAMWLEDAVAKRGRRSRGGERT